MNIAAAIDNISAHMRKLSSAHNELRAQFDLFLKADDTPRSITEELDALPGRRIFYNLSSRESFSAVQDGQQGNPLSFAVSQDGSFIMTHYPIVSWKPNSPAAASNFGQWSPVASWPLPLQQSTNQDIINLSYNFKDGGAQRNFDNEPALPLFSRFDALHPLPVPTLFAPNSNIQFVPTFEDIFFDPDSAVPTDGGELVVLLPGYRIVQL